MGVFSSAEVTEQNQGISSVVHNDFLAMLIECGIVGFVGYLFLLVTLGWILLRLRYRLPQQHPARSFLSVGWALFVAFAVMGISGALYTNVFVGWYYYGFIGFALAQSKGTAWTRYTRVMERRRHFVPAGVFSRIAKSDHAVRLHHAEQCCR